MKQIIFREWQEQKKDFLESRATRLSKLLPENRVSMRKRDAEQIRSLRQADKERAGQWERQGKMVWTASRQIKMQITLSKQS